jgi:hypothetical protein
MITRSHIGFLTTQLIQVTFGMSTSDCHRSCVFTKDWESEHEKNIEPELLR